MSSVTISGNPSGSGTFTVQSPNSNTSRTITLPDATTTLVGTDATQTLTNKTLQNCPVQGGVLTSDTAKASTSGTSIEFTGIPSWARRIVVALSGVSGSGSSNLLIQIGNGSFQTSGYGSGATLGGGNASSTIGFIITAGNAAGNLNSGAALLTNVTGNTWVSSATIGAAGLYASVSGGTVSLSGTLDRIRVTTVNGTDTFDAGTINILYEG